MLLTYNFYLFAIFRLASLPATPIYAYGSGPGKTKYVESHARLDNNMGKFPEAAHNKSQLSLESLNLQKPCPVYKVDSV